MALAEGSEEAKWIHSALADDFESTPRQDPGRRGAGTALQDYLGVQRAQGSEAIIGACPPDYRCVRSLAGEEIFPWNASKPVCGRRG